MRLGSVHNAETDQCLFSEVWQATAILDRMRGLLARPALQPQQGLWINPCPSVHTIGMRYAIDVVFLDGRGVIKKIRPYLQPLRFSASPDSRTSLELAAGSAEQAGLQPGMTLYWKS